VQKYSFKVPFKVPQIRPLADIVHFEIFTYLLTYLQTITELQMMTKFNEATTTDKNLYRSSVSNE